MNKITLAFAAFLLGTGAALAHGSEPQVRDPETGDTMPISQYDMSAMSEEQIQRMIERMLDAGMTMEDIQALLAAHPEMEQMQAAMQHMMQDGSMGGSGMGGSMGGSMGGGSGMGGGMGN